MASFQMMGLLSAGCKGLCRRGTLWKCPGNEYYSLSRDLQTTHICATQKHFQNISCQKTSSLRSCSLPSNSNLSSMSILTKFVPDVLSNFQQTCFYSLDLDSTDLQGLSLDKKIYLLIDKWNLDAAVELVKRAAALGVRPSGTTMMNLLKHLASLGDVDNSLELATILDENQIILKKNVYPHLVSAFYNSGQIEDGIEFMEMTYHVNRKFEEIDTLFALLATLTFKDFPEKSDLIEKFVNECRTIEGYKPVAHLWKCYMLVGSYEKADDLRESNQDNLKSYLPVVINEICQRKDKVAVNREDVVMRLCELPNLSQKQRVLIYETLIQILDSNQNWRKLLHVLLQAQKTGLPISKQTTNRCVKILENQLLNEATVDISDADISEHIEILKQWSSS